ncbi:unnamed protein product [Closterium sp. Naga37s-1]|nr:unnamed protein product [Closterium sp. Naga37s-1]
MQNLLSGGLDKAHAGRKGGAGRDMEEGCGSFMQNLLSGGLENAHAERKGRGGRGAVGGGGGGAEQMEKDLEGSWRIMDGGGKDGRNGKGAQWREHLKGCSHCSEEGSSSSSTGGGGSSSSVGATKFPKGMYLSGVGATDFALSVAAVLSKPQYCKESDFYFQDGNTASKTRVEDAAIETARERLQRSPRGEGGAASRGVGTTASASHPAVVAAIANTPVNTNPVVAVFTYRAARILQWARTYGSELIPTSQCCKDSPQEKVRHMRHPLRDLPSLLVRLGAIPKPLDQGEFPLEWEEWTRGDEAAGKLPDDANARFFHLGIVEEARGTAWERGAGEKGGQGSNAGGKTETAKGKGGDKRRGNREGRSRGSGEEGRIKGLGRSEDDRLLHQPLTGLVPLVQRKIPIVCCIADAEILVEFAGYLVKPPACAHCKQCLGVYSRRMPFLMVLTNYAYRPVTTLFNRFVSIFPPPSPEFDRLATHMGLPPFPASLPGFLRLPVVQARAEQVPIAFLLQVAYNWPLHILGMTDLKYVHMLRERKEEDGRVWEEVKMWCLAMLFAWTGGMKLEAEALSDTCKGRKERSGQDGGEGEEISSEKWREFWKRAAVPRFCEDLQDDGGPSGGASGSSKSSGSFGSSSFSRESDRRRGDDVKDKNEEEPAYLKAWPGGVNLVACLREMLLGEPCYRPAPRAAPSTPAAPPTVSAPNHANAPVSVTGGTGSAGGGESVCGAVGCGRVEGGAVKLKNCSGCGKVAYCSRECQKAHWPSHKLTCPGRTSGKKSGTDGSKDGSGSSGMAIGKVSGQGG